MDQEMIAEPIFICPKLAEEHGVPVTGMRSMIGSILPERNNAWLNAAVRIRAVFFGDNSDTKDPMRILPIPEVEEKRRTSPEKVKQQGCFSEVDEVELAYQMQAIQAIIAGYFGGYFAKEQPIGK